VVSITSKIDGQPVETDGTSKMSKSKNNGIDPQEIIDKFGADTVRLFMMFAAPPEQSLEWSDSAVEGQHKFLRRLWKTVHSHLGSDTTTKLDPNALNDSQKALRRKTHETIKKVSDDVSRRLTFNTAIAALMELLNEVNKHEGNDEQSIAVRHEALETAILLLSPIVPHICHELWQLLGHADPVIDASWPEVDESALVRSSLLMVVQVNGKVRSKIEVGVDQSKDEIQAIAMADENVQRFTEGMTVRKVIVVPQKLVNIVVG
ncbi:MAG: class I tRNA ligase family protein, partial [Pseudomonadales bacterium]|nr:class I tRNA ligase family protein [Pseudomonadales bacterium]